MRKQLGYAYAGDGIMFSPEDKVAIQEEIAFIDRGLEGKCNEAVRKKLTRQRRQMTAELVIGHFLPVLEEG